MRGQSGQAAVEWVGLLLLAALVLGALAALRAPAEDRGLGKLVAKRITCAAQGTCSAHAAPRRLGRGGVRRVASGVGSNPPSRARVVDAYRRLSAAGAVERVGAVAKRLWIVCLGYRRVRYELEHPRAPSEPMPLAEALDIANTCLNPASFLTDG